MKPFSESNSLHCMHTSAAPTCHRCARKARSMWNMVRDGFARYLLAREPKRYSGLIWIALAGKTFGPLGFVYSASSGALPWSFGWICVFNDVIWWPAFWLFALEHARERGTLFRW
jgi:hypothetical protein